MVERSNADESTRESSNGCPVQHTRGKSPSAASGNGQEPDNSSANSDHEGVWSGVASWLPFRGGGGGGGSGSSTTGTSASSAGGGSGGAATTPFQSGAVGTSERGGCQVNSSEGRDAPSSSGCPVQHDSAATATNAGSRGLGSIWGYLTGGDQGDGGDGSPAAPVAVAAPPKYNAMNNEYVYGNEVAPGQEVPLSTSRQRSSIPKAEFNPDHQPQEEADKWVYPSEQQYYNAIKRKGYKASAADMPSTLAIHNAVNEKGWEMVQEWERTRAEAESDGGGEGRGAADVPAPKLLRFTGRPQDTSPKAWVKSTLLGYRPPFDRHDWVVKRADGSEARYVIDFYAGKAPPGSSMPVAMHLDVRPALDSVDAAVSRMRMFYRKEVRPYLSGVLDAFKREPGPPPSDQDAPRPAR
eukprot:g10053.t1